MTKSNEHQDTTETAPETTTPKMKMHKLAVVFPEMAQAEKDALLEDIKANGLLEKILTYQGKIVDGRHRYEALRILKIDGDPQHYEEFKKDDTKPGTADDQLTERVMSFNLRRRHLNESQRAMVASKVANIPHGHKLTNTEGGIKLELASKLFNVSESLIGMAHKVFKHDDEKYIDAVFSGKMAVSKAKNIIKKLTPKPEKPTVSQMTAEYIKQRGVTLTKLPAMALLNTIATGTVSAIITDPPYNSGINSSGADGGGGWDFGFDPKPYLLEFSRVLKPGGSAVIFCNNRLLTEYIASSAVIGTPPTGAELTSALANFNSATNDLKEYPKIDKTLLKSFIKAEKEFHLDEENLELQENFITARKDLIGKDQQVKALLNNRKHAKKIYDEIRKEIKAENAKPLTLVQVLHWHKANNMNRNKKVDTHASYTPSIEYAVWLQKPGEEEPTWNRPDTFRDLFGDKRTTDIFKSGITIGYSNAEANRYSQNESLKPFRVIEMLVKTHSNKDEIVIDLFSGKGITPLVCYLTGRNCITSEMDARKVDAVQQWRLTDMFRFIAKEPALITEPLNFDKMMEIKAIAKILEANEITAESDLNPFREIYTYHRYINDVLMNSPEFKQLGGGAKDDPLKAERKAEWEAGEIVDFDYIVHPEQLAQDIHPSWSKFNYPEIMASRTAFDQFNPPSEDPLRQAYAREFKAEVAPYVFDVPPIGNYTLEREIPPEDGKYAEEFAKHLTGVPVEINTSSKRGKKISDDADTKRKQKRIDDGMSPEDADKAEEHFQAVATGQIIEEGTPAEA